MLATMAARWMLEMLRRDGCVYQDDTVDMLTNVGAEELLRENLDGNMVLGNEVLSAFKKISADAVWIKPDRYWRWRVDEDEPGREQRG
ncbi:hypothetical protein LMG26689_02623 [Achromobacter animicus]|uniref:DUF6953 family protein n=1 Tax=Achromobacter animicus TaxID=1389935 RepID=UPI001467CCCB|nr:hypothetical protein [Achromobacter animicus]CAB3863648.1 hypothetical protein LMG26689_02623 [Achromobacter animicus]